MSNPLPPPPNNPDSSQLYRWLYLVFDFVRDLTSGGSSGIFGPPGITTPDEGLVPGPDRDVDYLRVDELSLGTTVIQSTGAEINTLHGSNITRNTLSGVQAYSSAVFSCSINVGVETADVINVTADFYNANGDATSIPVGAIAWLSDDPQGLGVSATSPDTSVVALTGSLYDVNGSKVYFQSNPDLAGQLSIDITHTGAHTWYLAIQTAYNQLCISSAITFV